MLNSDQDPVGIFDSGVGGISVLCTAVKNLPNENYIYYADSAHAPYGTQPITAVKEHSFRVARLLLEKNIKALVIACNTATSAAVSDLRKSLAIPVIGMEPALKPAIENYGNGKIIVMATPMTLENSKFAKLMKKYGSARDIVPLPAPKLVELIERGAYRSAGTAAYLQQLLAPHLPDISSIVLGCTHFLYVTEMLQKIVGDNVTLIDGNNGTIRQLKRILRKRNLLNKSGGSVEILTSGDQAALELCNKLYQFGLENLTFYN